MISKRKIFSSSALIAGGQVLAQACAFTRNAIIARDLGPSELGIIATFWILLGLVTVITTLSIDRFIVQDKQGDSEKVIGTIHSIQILRGLLIACLLFGSSWFAAWIFGNEDALWAYQCLAIVPILGGLQNVNQYVWQRELHFFRTVSILLIPQFIALAATIPVLLYYPNYTAVVILLIVLSLFRLLFSHILATTKYVIAWDWSCFRRIWNFSKYILFGSILLYLGMAGDRIILGIAYPREELGWYATAGLLATAATEIVGKTMYFVGLPLLSNTHDSGIISASRQRTTYLSIVILVASLLAISLVLLGPFAVLVCYGDQYELSTHVIGILAVMASIRMIRGGIVTIAMSSGDTVPSLVGSIARTLSLGFVVVGAAMEASLPMIATLGLAGEVLAFFVVYSWTKRTYQLWNNSYLIMGFLAGGFTVLSYVTYLLMRDNAHLFWLSIPAVVYSFALLALSLILIPELRRNAKHILANIRN